MLLQTFKFPVLRGVGLSVGFAFLLSNTSVTAFPRSLSQAFNVAQSNSSIPPVVVDTDGGTTGTSPGTSIPRDIRFSCQVSNGEYTVMYQPESQPSQFFPWATPSALGGGWGPQRRCNEISRRLELYRPDGLLELTTGVENNYNTVCVTTERDSSCRIVMTVPPGQDPLITRDRVFENLTIADSGQQTDAVYTYRGRNNEIDELVNAGRSVLGGKNSRARSNSINLRPFLDRADGGTGALLRGGVSQPSNNRRLNPGSFR